MLLKVYVTLINLYVEEESAKTANTVMNARADQDSPTMVTNKWNAQVRVLCWKFTLVPKYPFYFMLSHNS